MNVTDAAAVVFASATVFVVLFQLALALGARWGEYTMGGKFPGRLPTGMRVAAVAQASVLALLGAVVLSRAGLLLPGWSNVSSWLIWGVVGFSALSFVLNVITPSRGERLRWGPVTLVMLVSSLVVALSGA